MEYTLLYAIVSPNPFHVSLLSLPTSRADVRAGHSENAWVNITHLITYHRYLRFMPNGVVLSLLANEDQSPHDVVHYLKPGLKMKVCLLLRIIATRLSYMTILIHYSQGFSTGTWTLDPSTSTVHVRPSSILQNPPPTACTCTSHPTARYNSKPPAA
jgi:hypothetical protein